MGAKCVSFYFTREAAQGWLMGSAVIWINAESTALGSVAEASGVLGRAQATEEQRRAKAAEASAGAERHGEDGEGASSTAATVHVTTSAAGRYAVFIHGLC